MNAIEKAYLLMTVPWLISDVLVGDVGVPIVDDRFSGSLLYLVLQY